MATEVRKITLTDLGSDAGPYFSVQYSTDCITYSQSVDCTNIFLPSIGSFAYSSITCFLWFYQTGGTGDTSNNLITTTNIIKIYFQLIKATSEYNTDTKHQ